MKCVCLKRELESAVSVTIRENGVSLYARLPWTAVNISDWIFTISQKFECLPVCNSQAQ